MLFPFVVMAPKPAIIPAPSHMQVKAGTFPIAATTTIAVNAETAALGRMLQDFVSPGTGFPLALTNRAGNNTISLRIDPSRDDLGAEGYRLEVTPSWIEISAKTPAGVFYGMQSLRQLLPASTFRRANLRAESIPIPCVEITDLPRFTWRGAHLDVSRHFMPKEYLFRFIDRLAMHKLNVFHLHLTDDQGWRMEINKYPKLTEVGAWHRANKLTNDPTTWETMPDGGFYTQDDLRELVAYARDRNITIVPEIEMPGHAMAAIVAYPELGNTGKQFELKGVNEGADDVVNVSPATLDFFKDVLAEVMDVFPSEFIHIGGDEVWKDPWKNNPAMQKQMQQLALRDEHELQSWFIKQIDGFLTSKGRRMVGWDEILEGGLAPGATVMSWRGIDGGVAAAKAGHDVVMASNTHLYLDYYQSADRSTEPLAIGGLIRLETVYGFEPIPASLSADEGNHILGLQGQLWTEYMPNPVHVDYMAFPRLCAVAEVAWSPRDGRNYDDFMSRLRLHVERLAALDIGFRPLDKAETPPAGTWTSGEFTEAATIKTWEVTSAFPSAGNFDVRFQYLSGLCRLDIDWAELIVDDVVVSRDEHSGSTGSVDSNNVYHFELKSLPPNARIQLRASVHPDGGTDSNGEIRVHRRP